MRPSVVFANSPPREIEQLRDRPRGPWRQGLRAVMTLLSLHGLPAGEIAALLDCHPSTVRCWISRFNAGGAAGLAGRPRCGRPRLGGRRLPRRIAALLQQPGPWTVPQLWRYLGRPALSPRTLYRRVRLVAVWRRPKLTARGDPARDQAVAAILALLELPRRALHVRHRVRDALVFSEEREESSEEREEPPQAPVLLVDVGAGMAFEDMRQVRPDVRPLDLRPVREPLCLLQPGSGVGVDLDRLRPLALGRQRQAELLDHGVHVSP